MTYISQYPLLQNDTYVKATTYDVDNPPFFATDPTKSLIGSSYANSWWSAYPNNTNQRFHIDLGSVKVITRIYYENGHHNGSSTNSGIKNFTLWGSNYSSAFSDLTYGNDADWTEITVSQNYFDQHTGSNIVDPKYITVSNTIPYRYYAIKIADNWGGTSIMSLRRIELQTCVESVSRITNFVTKLTRNSVAQTVLDVILNRTLGIFNTQLFSKLKINNLFNTNLTTKLSTYDTITPKSINDIVVKKDGVELLDVDYSSLNIVFNLNRSPSEASFTLARHHDNFDCYLNGTSSIISANNKIQIYDGTILLFTGYITQISSNSSTDTVSVVAQDVRCKINKLSLSLEYGVKSEIVNDIIVNTRITTAEALDDIYAVITALISGHESLDVNFTPEYSENTSDCGSLLDTVINNAGNINWYIDENEYLRFQRVERGTLKTLPLSGVSAHRHIYDTVLNDIIMNRLYENYYTAFKVNFGKLYTRKWVKNTVTAGINYDENFRLYPKDAKDVTHYAFQHHHQTTPLMDWTEYNGSERTSIWSTNPIGLSSYMTGWFTVQWLATDEYTDITPVVVGSGTPQKDVYLTGYGKKVANVHWEEQEDKTTLYHYLCEVNDEVYDYTAYALDAANFELSQNNKLITEATVTLILDAFEYYGITMKDLINLSNTIASGCFTNNNGFPLNISGISIDCSTRLVTINITNYGKSYYQRTGDYALNYQSNIAKRIYRETPAHKGASEIKLVM